MPRKLTRKQADEMRALYDESFDLKAGDPDKWTLKKLAEKYAMNYTTVQRIIKLETYNDG